LAPSVPAWHTRPARACTFVALACTLARGRATAQAPQPPPVATLAALAPGDDALEVVAIGAGGEVYEPDGTGAWVRRMRVATADRLSMASRAGRTVVAFGEGIVYRLAPNGWSAIRLHQKSKAVMSGGAYAVAAVGRQLFALDRSAGGEPLKLALAPINIVAIGASIGTSAPAIVVLTDRGALLRVAGTKISAIANAPRKITHLVSDRWALVQGGAVDLRSNRKTSWPAGLQISVAAQGPNDRLVGVARQRGKLELVTVSNGNLEREVAAAAADGVPVAVAVDAAGRAVIALRDGLLVVRDKGTWTATSVRDEPPSPHSGPPPARSP
jgi:hypothetical protein